VPPPIKKLPYDKTNEELDVEVRADVKRQFAPKRLPPKQVYIEK
jgi:hypothetical protein